MFVCVCRTELKPHWFAYHADLGGGAGVVSSSLFVVYTSECALNIFVRVYGV